MRARTAIVGLSTLLICALSAQAASATNGTTLFTCSSDANLKTFKTEHCKASDGAGEAFGHVEVPPGLETSFEVTNAKTGGETTESTVLKLRDVIGGMSVSMTATGLSSKGGEVVNLKDEITGEHAIHGENLVLIYTGVTVDEPPKCAVEGLPGGFGKVETRTLAGTTVGKGDSLVISPEEGNLIAEYKFVNNGGACALNGITAKVIGSIGCKPDGATVSCSHNEVTTAKTLRTGTITGPIVGYEGLATVSGWLPGEEPTPLAATTIAT